MLRHMRTVALAVVVPLLAAGCSPVWASASPASHAAPVRLPLPRAVAKRLPDGVFYVLAGPRNVSFNLWEVSNTGQEIQLTHNPALRGVLDFDASDAGIVMDDSAHNGDYPSRLTASGEVPLKGAADGQGPSINSAGEISYDVSTSDENGNPTGDKLIVMKSFNAPGRVVYQQHDFIMATSWGPDQSIAILSGEYYPGSPGSPPKILTIDKSGQATPVPAGASKTLGYVIWNEQAGDLGVGLSNDNGEAIDGSARRYLLPGWLPEAWNAAGTQLLVRGPGGQLGLWSPDDPGSVHVIGPLAANLEIAQIVWLPKPAKL
jgi:hypothetical protein